MDRIRQEKGSENDHRDKDHRYKIGYKGFRLPSNLIPVKNIFQEYRNGNRLDNNGFEQNENKVHHIDLNQFNKCYTKKQNSLECQNADIGKHPVGYADVNEADCKYDKENIYHFRRF
jgi:hypothetical protein